MSKVGDLGGRWADVTLRTKITVVTVFILFLGLIVAGVGTFSVLRPMLINTQTAALIQLQNDPSPVMPGADPDSFTQADITSANSQYYVALLDTQGSVKFDNSANRKETALPYVLEGVITYDWVINENKATFSLPSLGQGGANWQVVAIPMVSGDQPSGVLLIAESTARINQMVAQYVIVFTGFGIAVILLGAALTRILITTTLLPLAEVERTALEISRGDFSKRILVASPHTEVGHLGESLNVMLDRLDGSVEDRERTINRMRRFVGDAGHELRTPLVSVRGYAELYRMGALQSDEQITQAMDRIESEAIRMTSLVEDLLALARLDERRPLELEPLPLNQLARDAALDAVAGAPDREVTVREDESDPLVWGDEHKVRQLFTNLIGNAMQHTEEGSPIEIAVTALPAVQPVEHTAPDGAGAQATKNSKFSPNGRSIAGVKTAAIGKVVTNGKATPNGKTSANGTAAANGKVPVTGQITTPQPAAPRMARFEIIDHGEGVPEQVRDRIFGRFWRADSSRNRETGGSGLGLAIVKSIVSAHHGHVSVHETPGGGATFRVDLPAAQ